MWNAQVWLSEIEKRQIRR